MLMETKTLLEANNKKKIFQFLLVCCSVNHVNLCKFAASFPGVFAVSCTRICYKNLGKRCSVYVYVYSSFFSLFWAVHYNVPWKVYSPRIPSHNNLTLFLAHWLGNFSTISLNQICCLFSLITFQDSRNNKCQSIQTVFCFLKIKLSSACIIQDEQTNN